ncbi:hypothetical protein ACP70R_046866 [Stipagrostis hirtigluma subsp. patula]
MRSKAWMRGLQRMSNNREIRQFVDIWRDTSSVQLGDQPDEIRWRFGQRGVYSSKSAYEVQFVGAQVELDWTVLWRVKTEPKCNFFCWLLVQNKLWTSDRILRRGGQANRTCSLIWDRMSTMTGFNLRTPGVSTDLKHWWRQVTVSTDAEQLQCLVYTAWNIWKERCRRVYQQQELRAEQVALLARQDVAAYNMAHTDHIM